MSNEETGWLFVMYPSKRKEGRMVGQLYESRHREESWMWRSFSSMNHKRAKLWGRSAREKTPVGKKGRPSQNYCAWDKMKSPEKSK